MDLINTIFLAWTGVIPIGFIFGVGALCIIHAGFFSVIDNWL
jgi:hypothetical protein